MKSVDKVLSEAAAPVRKLYEETIAERDALAEKVAQNRADLVKVTRALKATDPTFAEESKPKPKGKKKNVPFVPSDEILAKVFEAIRDGAETSKEIGELAGVSSATVKIAVSILREKQMIRKAGHRQAPGKPITYKALPLNEEAGV